MILDKIRLKMDIIKYVYPKGNNENPNLENILNAYYFNPEEWNKIEADLIWGGLLDCYLDEIEKFEKFRENLHKKSENISLDDLIKETPADKPKGDEEIGNKKIGDDYYL